MNESNFSRRRFLTNVAAVGAVGAIGVNILTSCSEKKKAVELHLPPLLSSAPDGPLIKAGVIGCGGRGSGAALDFLSAGPNLVIHALGDVLQDRIDECRQKLKSQKNVDVPDENIFVGFDAFEKVLDSGVDLVILATPPHFRPQHFEAAVQARKHVFMEKPIAVDPAGIRSVMATAKKAESLNLKVGTGTQRRHQPDYIEVYKQVMNGAIGEITAANCYWNQSQLWFRNPKPEWNEMEYMIRDWVNWTWLSGDHIVEQHVHNLDVIGWFTGMHPVKAVGFGSRQRRQTGDQYDNFSVDFVYDNGMHMHSMCRQINGCVNNVSEFITGTKGSTNCKDTIFDPTGGQIFSYPYPLDEKGEQMKNVKISPYVQEHIDLVTCIRQNIAVNEAGQTAVSNMVGIMGRVSAYTGKEVTWEEMMNSDLKLGPSTYVMGPVGIMETAKVPVPGEA